MRRKREFLLLLLPFSVVISNLYLIGIPPVNSYSDTRTDPTGELIADWGDVVHVKYSLWLDEEHTIEKQGNMGVDLYYVYLRKSLTEQVPPEVFQALPSSAKEELQQVYLQKFIDEIIGMRINQEKSFMITAADSYGDEDLFYNVSLKAIVYQAVILTSATAVSATSNESSSLIPTITALTTPEISSLPNFLMLTVFLLTLVVSKRFYREE